MDLAQDTRPTPPTATSDPGTTPSDHPHHDHGTRDQSPPYRSPGTSGLDAVPGDSPEAFPFRPDAPEPRGFPGGDSSISEGDHDLFVGTDKPGTDLAQRGLCAAEVKAKGRTSHPRHSKTPGESGRDGTEPLDRLSRAAPRRPYESGPFLSIDTLPRDKREAMTAKAEMLSSRDTTNYHREKLASHSRVSINSMQSGGGSQISDWNSIVPRPRKNTAPPPSTANYSTRAPFKHDVKGPSHQQVKKEKRPVSPGAAMKEVTMLATYQVAQNVATWQPEPKAQQTGRLLKGRLQPLTVVKSQGPSIEHCRGIVPDHRDPVPSNSKTLQRRRQVYAGHVTGDPYERPHTVESVHQPSIASDVSDAASLREDLAAMDKIKQDKEIADYMKEQGYGEDLLMQNNLPDNQENGSVYITQERPKTVSELSRKSVRFDESSQEEDTTQRSKSASAKIKVAESGCKPEVDENRNQYDDEEDDERNPRTGPQSTNGNRCVDSHTNAQSTSYSSTTGGNNNEPASGDDEGRQQQLQVMLQDEQQNQPATSRTVMVNDFAELSSGYRVHFHEQEAHPDGDVMRARRLVHTGRPSCYQPEDGVYQKRARRPQSAKIYRQKEKKNRLKRPQSAKASLNCAIASQKRTNVYQRSAGGRPASAVGKSPKVGIHLALTAPQSNNCDPLLVPKVHKADGPVIGILGTTMAGAAKQEISRPDINYSNIRSPSYAHVKSTIPKPLKKRASSAKQLSITYEKTMNSSTKDVVKGENVDEESADQTFLTQMADEEVVQGDNSAKTSRIQETSDAKREHVLLNLESLEQSLDHVQAEIQRCLQQVHSSRGEQDSKADSEAEPVLVQNQTIPADPGELGIVDAHIPDLENYRKSLEDCGLAPGVVSDLLTEKQTGKTYKIKVFHCEGKEQKNGSIDGEGNDEDQGLINGHIREQDDVGVSEDDATITTYDTTIMKTDDTGNGSDNSSDSCPLEVQATAAVLNQSRTHKGARETLQPPLCFKVNARPPDGYLYYFAYGLDMNPNRMSVYLERDMTQRLWGLLYGFKLVFNKKGEELEAGLFPNLEFNPLCSVEGCLYLITPEELEKLDKRMGYPEHYEHVVLPIWMLNCLDAEQLGVAQYCVAGLMYVAQDLWIQTGNLDPYISENNMKQCALNSDLSTEQYRSHLIDSMP